MKRFKNLVIGGIQNKIFNLILLTVFLLTLANFLVYMYSSHMLSSITSESGKRQQEAIEEITTRVMDEQVSQTLERANQSEAVFADKLFSAASSRVIYLADYAAKLFANPEAYDLKDYKGPDPGDDGKWTAKVIYAEGVDASDPAITSRVGLLANMSEMMLSLCPAVGAANVYIGLPEGVHLSVSTVSSSWFEDGQVRSFDPRERMWYKDAVEAGGVIFTDGEYDALTGGYCIECAAPVYGPDGRLCAVVGTDLFLNEMQEVLERSTIDGEYQLLVNKDGQAVLAPEEASFPLDTLEHGTDLRESGNALLAETVRDALDGNTVRATEGELSDGTYYITASPIKTPQWVLVSAYSKETADQAAAALKEQNRQIQEDAIAAYQEKSGKSKMTALVLLLVTAALMLTGALVLGTRIVKPLNYMMKRIAHLGENNLEFRMEDAYRTGDEVEELAESFAALSHKTVIYLDTVKRVTAEKERIGAELSLAMRIQAAMIPHIIPAFPDRTDFDIIGYMNPAKEVGGDFYDYFLIDDDHLCMVMADVSGKGVPAALLMMASTIILQSVAMLGSSPAEILKKTNDAICSNNEAEMFVTVWLGILELSTGKLTAANAGHEYPAITRPDGTFVLYRDLHGFVIGGLEDVEYKEYELILKPGNKLFVYTDGVVEATNREDELFGKDRMIRALNVRPEASPQEILACVKKAVDDFVQDAEQFDDLTMLCLEYKGPGK